MAECLAPRNRNPVFRVRVLLLNLPQLQERRDPEKRSNEEKETDPDLSTHHASQ